MNVLNLTNLYAALSDAIPDRAVGVSLAHLAGDEQFSMYATELPPNKQLNAHYHQAGNEFLPST